VSTSNWIATLPLDLQFTALEWGWDKLSVDELMNVLISFCA
jgi:hypothetical protein